MKKIALLGILVVLSTAVLAQNQTKIPFRLTSYNNIVVKVVLNKQDTVSLMLHTGATDVDIMEDVLPKLKSIKFSGKVDSVKSWGGANNSSDYSVKNSLTIGDLNWQNVVIWKDKYSGQETEGKFGLNFFEKKVLEFDFDKNVLIISTEMPRNLKKYKKMQLNFDRDLMFIKATCQVEQKQFVNEFMIHSGYAGDILLDDKFANDNHIGELIKITGEKKLQDSFGNTIVTKKGILPVFKLGELQLANIPVGFFEGNIGRQTMSIIGGDIFKRFNWIFDAQRKYVYLKPNKLYKTEYSNK